MSSAASSSSASTHHSRNALAARRKNVNFTDCHANQTNYCSLPRNLKQAGRDDGMAYHHNDDLCGGACYHRRPHHFRQHHPIVLIVGQQNGSESTSSCNLSNDDNRSSTTECDSLRDHSQPLNIYWRVQNKCSIDSRLKTHRAINSPMPHRVQSKEHLVNGGGHPDEPDYRRVSRRQQNDDEFYEMSSDLHQKQLEILCKRYGGYCRARRAAVVIQRSYRKYTLERNFERVRKRRSGIPSQQQQQQQRSDAFFNNFDFVSKICVNDDKEDQDAEKNRTKPGQCPPNDAEKSASSAASSATNCYNKRDECRLFYHNQDRKFSAPSHFISSTISSSHASKRDGNINQSNVSYVKVGTETGGELVDNYANYCARNASNRDDKTLKKYPPGGLTGSELPTSKLKDVNEPIDYACPTNTARCNAGQKTKVRIPVRKDCSVDYNARSCNKGVCLLKHEANHDYMIIDNSNITSALQSGVQFRKSYAVCAAKTSIDDADQSNDERETASSLDLGEESDSSATTVRYYRLPASASREDLLRRRQYRIALNFFNKKPERGIEFLICWGFVARTPEAVAAFLAQRKGISRQMIGEYLGSLQNPFNQRVLSCFADQVDMRGMQIDVALRLFLSLFRLPGEAQKIERIVEIFARRYCQCNSEITDQFSQSDTVFIIAFAIIMLNTDLHSPNVKASKRMRVEDFIKNLRGIDAGSNVDPKLLTNVYNRVKQTEFRADPDHVTQVLKVESSLAGKKPTLALPHRRLVCYCRLNEIPDPSKKQSPNVHQREVFLFNDMLMVTKVLSRKKCGITYSYRESHCLVGAQIHTFKNQHYACGVEVDFVLENKKLYFNTRTEEDKVKFVEDLKESIHETDEMEALRIELELQKQSGNRCSVRCLLGHDSFCHQFVDPESSDKSRQGSNRASSFYDHDASNMHRHSSATSIDSGMSSASLCSRESFQHAQNKTLAMIQENTLLNGDAKSLSRLF